MDIILGNMYRDRITGFKGVATGRCEYISGCNQVLLSPKSDSGNGAFIESHWLDEQRLELEDSVTIVLDNSDNPGFGKPAPRI